VPYHPIGPYEHLQAVCGPYDPRAPKVARRISEMIGERIRGIAVEHVGSTAVPGCAGKGVVDLMIPYRRGELSHVLSALEDLGFGRQGSSDPFPEDRPMRVGSLKHDGDTFRLHVHVVPADGGEPEEFRLFRDRLRSDPGLLRGYVDRKRRIIEEGTTNSVEYAQRKGDFVRQALDEMGR
jgi:GrpB-like predicted nucleotidyltransferase (UPF0157 family)